MATGTFKKKKGGALPLGKKKERSRKISTEVLPNWGKLATFDWGKGVLLKKRSFSEKERGGDSFS